MHTSARYATQASNPGRADKVPGRPCSATHTCAPCLGQLCRVAAHYCGLDSASTHHSAEPTRSRSPGRTDTAAAAAAAAATASTDRRRRSSYAASTARGQRILLGSRQMLLPQWLMLMRDSKVCSRH